MGRWARAGVIAFVGWMVGSLASPALCFARRGGIAAEGCGGCHNGGAEPEIRVTPLSEPVPGQALRLRIEIEAVNGPVAGFYMTADVPDSLSSIAGQGTQRFSNGGIAHTSPKTGSGLVQFEVSWMAPADPTGVQFHVWAVSANENARSSGDGANDTLYSLVSGCEGEMYFRDFEREGYGSTVLTRVDCADRDGYSKTVGDCNDNDERINPGVAEFC